MSTEAFQNTLKRSFTYQGAALHSGENVFMRCLPAVEDSGIVFRRVDLQGCPAVKASPQNVISTKRCTSLGNRDCSAVVHAVEHLLASFSMAGIDNAVVELDGSEVPAGDGSALAFMQLIEQSGRKRQKKAACVINISRPAFARKNDALIAALPFDGFRISYTLSYNHPFVGTQYFDFSFNGDVFFREIAPARTFGFSEEVEELHRSGLALGGSLSNAVLVTREGAVNDLRFSDEPVRHKILDMVGDLALAGRVRGHFIGVKSGHTLNVELSKLILEECIPADMQISGGV